MRTTFSPDTLLGDLTYRYPEALAVFQRFGIESCRGARSPLAQVCREHQLSYGRLAHALSAALSRSPGLPASPDTEWPRRPLADLTAHIVTAFHEPLRRELARLERLTLLLQGHGNAHRRALAVLLPELTRMRDELEAHMGIEERELFPLIDGVTSADVTEEDRCRLLHLRGAIEAEHADAIQTLRIFEQITEAFRPPDGTCGMLHDLYRGLEELQHVAHLHRDFEKGLLFPRVFAVVGAC